MCKKELTPVVLEYLKERMKECKYSYRGMAEILDITHATLNNKINGTRYFTTKEIREICELLDIPLNEINVYFFNDDM